MKDKDARLDIQAIFTRLSKLEKEVNDKNKLTVDYTINTDLDNEFALISEYLETEMAEIWYELYETGLVTRGLKARITRTKKKIYDNPKLTPKDMKISYPFDYDILPSEQEISEI